MMMRIRRLIRIALVLLIAAGMVLIALYPRAAGPAEGTSFMGAAVEAPSRSSLRMGTFNIDGGRGTDGRLDLERTARCLQRLDFVTLNEVHASLLGDENQAKILGGLLKLPYLFAPSERRLGKDVFGNAVYTDAGVLHWRRMVLPAGVFSAKRSFVLTDIDWHGATIHVISTHVDWRSSGDEQLKIVSELFLSLPSPVVLMGDLNHPPSSPLIQSLLHTAGVEESVEKVLGGETTARVDWIFVRGLRTLDAGVVNLGASDHPAYWAEVTPQ